ncbi:MAG: carboxypeptidase-like regulatory domain-containing protein, partial [Bacteroidota bacterium]|nr:carboxypeptidase-like regulatory domain-containing protein [Bacteroidota bacterium]
MKKRSTPSCLIAFSTLLFAFFCCCPSSLQAQKKILVSGYVLEAESSEDLIGAVIQVENADIAVVTNTYGYYALSLLPGSYRIQCSFIGLQESIVEVNLIDSNVVLNFELASDEDFLQEVVVTGERE